MSNHALIAAMNEQLSAEYQAIIQYIQYSAIVSGPQRPQLAAFFREEIPDEQKHAQYLADKVSVLGATPTTAAKPVLVGSSPRELLENVLEGEKHSIAAYTRLIDLADEAGEVGIRIRMEDFVQDENAHRDETLKILEGPW